MKKNILLFALSAALTVGCVGFVASCASNSSDSTTESAAQEYEQTASTEATALSAEITAASSEDTVTSYAEEISAQSESSDILHTTGKIAANTQVDAVADASTKGISVGFFLTGCTSDWSSVVNADNYKLTYANLDPWFSTGACAGTNMYPSASAFGGVWDCLLNTEDAHVLINVATDGVTFYKNGEKVFYYGADEYMAGSTTVKVSQFIEGFLAAVEDGGFVFQEVEYTINELFVNYAVASDDDAYAMYESQYAEYGDKVTLTIDYVYEDGTTAAESDVVKINIGNSYSFTAPYIENYLPERESYTFKDIQSDMTYKVVYSVCGDHKYDYIDYGTIGKSKLTVPENITLEGGMTVTFLLSGTALENSWSNLLSTDAGYNITYGNLDSYARNSHNNWPSATAFGGDNWDALCSTDEIFVAITIRQDSITFYVNGEKVIQYAAGDKMQRGTYDYYVGDWARNMFKAMLSDGFTINPQTYHMRRLTMSGAYSDERIARIYEDVQENYQSELVVKYICAEENNNLIGEYRWKGMGTAYSITPPDIVGYEVIDGSTLTGRAENGRTTIHVYYKEKGIATLTCKYIDTSGNELKESVTEQITIPVVERTAPTISGYTVVDGYDYRCLTTMKHGGEYTFIFMYEKDPHVHTNIDFTVGNAVVSYCKTCGAVTTKFDGTEVSVGSATALKNNDTSGDWWTGNTDTFNVSDDFIIKYTWTNTRDTAWSQDAVIELVINGGYWDQNCLVSGGWGSLLEGGTITRTWYLNGSTTTEVAQNTTDYFAGDYTVTIVRNNGVLFICETLVKTNGDVYSMIIEQASIDTGTVTAGIVGNPYYLDDITVATYQV